MGYITITRTKGIIGKVKDILAKMKDIINKKKETIRILLLIIFLIFFIWCMKLFLGGFAELWEHSVVIAILALYIEVLFLGGFDAFSDDDDEESQD